MDWLKASNLPCSIQELSSSNCRLDYFANACSDLLWDFCNTTHSNSTITFKPLIYYSNVVQLKQIKNHFQINTICLLLLKSVSISLRYLPVILLSSGCLEYYSKGSFTYYVRTKITFFEPPPAVALRTFCRLSHAYVQSCSTPHIKLSCLAKSRIWYLNFKFTCSL